MGAVLCQKIRLQIQSTNWHMFFLFVVLIVYIKRVNQKGDRMNGWKDYETWNVSLWIQNTECLYRLALECTGFQQWKNVMKNDVGSFFTDDGVAWDDADYCEVQSMFNEMKATTDLHHWSTALKPY